MAAGKRMWGVMAFGVLSLAGLAAAQVVLPARPELPVATAERAAQPVRITEITFQTTSGLLPIPARYARITRWPWASACPESW